MALGHSCWRLACAGFIAVSAAWSAEPWHLVPLPADGWAQLDVQVGGTTVRRAQVARETDGRGTVLRVEVSAGQNARRFAVAAFDQARQPLAAGCDLVVAAPAAGPLTRHESVTVATLAIGEVDTAAVAYLAAGPVAVQAPTETNLCAENGGARVREASSVYSEGYGCDRILDGRADTFWASTTGQVTNQWLIIDLPGDEPLEIAEIGIDGHGEPGDPKSALRHFVVLASETGSAEADFREVLRDECAFGAGLQRWRIGPIKARWLKLVCLDNWGSTQWLELAGFECFAPDRPAPPRTELVQEVAQFELPRASTVDVRSLGGGVVDEDLLLLRLLVPAPQTPPPPAWRVALDGCREGSARVEQVSVDQAEFSALRLDFAFGNLLGGLPQSCLAVLDRALCGQPRRLQVTYRTDRPGNNLRASLAVRDKPAALIDLGRTVDRAWHVASAPLTGLAEPGGRLVGIGVSPRGRENLSGSLWLAQVLAISAPPN